MNRLVSVINRKKRYVMGLVFVSVISFSMDQSNDYDENNYTGKEALVSHGKAEMVNSNIIAKGAAQKFVKVWLPQKERYEGKFEGYCCTCRVIVSRCLRKEGVISTTKQHIKKAHPANNEYEIVEPKLKIKCTYACPFKDQEGNFCVYQREKEGWVSDEYRCMMQLREHINNIHEEVWTLDTVRRNSFIAIEFIENKKAD